MIQPQAPPSTFPIENSISVWRWKQHCMPSIDLQHLEVPQYSNTKPTPMSIHRSVIFFLFIYLRVPDWCVLPHLLTPVTGKVSIKLIFLWLSKLSANQYIQILPIRNEKIAKEALQILFWPASDTDTGPQNPAFVYFGPCVPWLALFLACGKHT